jgi:mono/diheme cytochrome c family protein
MKFTCLIIIGLLSIWSTELFAQKKIAPDFPKEMLAHVKVEYLLQYEKGQVLYNINCARCHTEKVSRKEIVPDFTDDQLVGYELRVLNPKHESDIPETTVTAEELGLIMTFLKYKKKNN